MVGWFHDIQATQIRSPPQQKSKLSAITPGREHFNQRSLISTADAPAWFCVPGMVVHQLSPSTPSATHHLLLSPRELLACFFDARLMGTTVMTKNLTSRTIASESLSHQLCCMANNSGHPSQCLKSHSFFFSVPGRGLSRYFDSFFAEILNDHRPPLESCSLYYALECFMCGRVLKYVLHTFRRVFTRLLLSPESLRFSQKQVVAGIDIICPQSLKSHLMNSPSRYG